MNMGQALSKTLTYKNNGVLLSRNVDPSGKSRQIIEMNHKTQEHGVTQEGILPSAQEIRRTETILRT